MAKKLAAKIVTANNLLDGEVVYFTANFDWSKNYKEAIIAYEEGEAEKLLAKAELQQDKIVGAYLADISFTAEREFYLTHFREKFRANRDQINCAPDKFSAANG